METGVYCGSYTICEIIVAPLDASVQWDLFRICLHCEKPSPGFLFKPHTSQFWQSEIPHSYPWMKHFQSGTLFSATATCPGGHCPLCSFKNLCRSTRCQRSPSAVPLSNLHLDLFHSFSNRWHWRGREISLAALSLSGSLLHFQRERQTIKKK